MGNSLKLIPKESKVIKYKNVVILPKSPLTPKSNKYFEDSCCFTRFIIGENYSKRVLPEGTMEIHDIKLIDEKFLLQTAMRNATSDTKESIIKIKSQVIRYVKATYPITVYDTFHGFTNEGEAKIDSIIMGFGNYFPNLIDIHVEEHPPKEMKNLEKLLGITNVLVIPHVKIDFKIIEAAK
jgi:hypothetical protein